MKKMLHFFVLPAMLFVTSAWSQKMLNYSFQHLNQNNGFPVESVRSFEFDSLGQLWAVTEKGLMCYNGHSGKFYLPQSDVANFTPYKLFIDSRDNIWISYLEQPMVSCFNMDSESFSHFRHNPKIEGSFCNAMASEFFEDSKGRLWIGSWGDGMNQFDYENQRFKHYRPSPFKAYALQSSNVVNFAELPDGKLVICSWEGDGMDNFLSTFDPTTQFFSAVDIKNYAFENDIERQKIMEAFRIVHFVHLDSKENWWVGTYTGLFYVDHQNETVIRKTGLDKSLLYAKGHITFDNVVSALPENGVLTWFPTEVDGILVYDQEKDEVGYIRKNVDHPSSISGNVIRDAAKDQFGNIWVATKSGGLDVYSPNANQVKIVSNQFLYAEKMHNAQGLFAINDMTVSNTSPNILVAHGNGFSIYNVLSREVHQVEVRRPFLEALKKNPALEEFHTNNPNFVGRIHEMKDRYVLDTYCGVIHYFPSTGQFDFTQMDRFDGFHPEGYYGQDELLVLGWKMNDQDLNHTDLISYIGKLNTSTLKDEPLLYLPTDIRTGEPDDYRVFEAIDSVNYYVRYSDNSFLIYNATSNTYDTYSYESPYQNFPDSSITLLHIGNFGIVWLKTANGIYAFDPKTKEITDIKPNLHLKPNDEVMCLTRDKFGVLWIALNYDLVRYNPNTEESFRFNKKHGFDAGGFTQRFIRKHDLDEVIIPANYGLLVFDPRRIYYHTSSPRIFISNIIVDKDTLLEKDERAFVSSHQNLRYDQNFITIEFASNLLYAASGKSYEYRLIGLDTNWTRTNSQNAVSYTNLQPGNYEFQVRCIDGYENISETLVLSFSIDQPFWLKWWFIAAEIGLGLLLIFIYIKYRERSLKRTQARLERAVQIRTQEVQEKVVEIEHQKEIIEVKNKELTDSINYAKGIQDSLLAHRDLLESHLSDFTILFKPKDIVSGDFYWAAATGQNFFLAICDSTGHGVPGAFMSLLNIRYLYEAVVEKKIEQPNIVLDYVRMKLIENLAVDGAKDGMDGTLIRFDADQKSITYSSSQNHPVLIRDGKATYLPADKMPIGGGYHDSPFQPHQIDLQSGDVLYFFTDGYPDQFGGPKGGKLKHANLIKLLITIHHLPMEEQLDRMENHLADWKGNLEQLDDILLFAFRVE